MQIVLAYRQGNEVGIFVTCLKDNGMTFEQMQLIQTADWSQPLRLRSHGSENSVRKCPLFHEKKINASGYKGSATELVTLLPLLEFMAHTLYKMTDDGQPLQHLRLQFDSFLAACEVGREYMTLKRAGNDEAQANSLESALQKHGKSFVAAYGEDMCKPKNHFSFHIARHAMKLPTNCSIDCWPGERKNKDYKELCDNGRLSRLQGLEKSALARLLNIQVQEMKRQPLLFDSHLGDPSYDCTELQEGCRVAKCARLSGVEVGLDDVFLSKDKTYALQVVVCLSLGNDIGALVKKMQFASRFGNSLKYRIAECPLQLLEKIDKTLGVASYWHRDEDTHALLRANKFNCFGNFWGNFDWNLMGVFLFAVKRWKDLLQVLI